MFKNIFSKTSSSLVGIEVHSDSLSAIALKWDSDIPSILHMNHVELTENTSVEQVLKTWVSDHQLTKARCNVVLQQGSYQLLLVEPPDVPPESLREAIRYKLKDLLVMPLDEAVIDVFPLPEDGTKAKKTWFML